MLALGLLLVPGPRGAPTLSAQQVNVHVYTNLEGLPQSQVLSLHQASSGHLWVGTFGGAARFNGREFRSLTTAHGLGSNLVGALADGPEGQLVAGFVGGGICRLDRPERPLPPEEGAGPRCLTPADGLPSGDVLDLAVDDRGRTWIAAQGGLGLLATDGTPHRWVLSDDEGTPATPLGLALEPDRGLWVATARGLALLDPDALAADPSAPPEPLWLELPEPSTAEGSSVDLVKAIPAGLLVTNAGGIHLVPASAEAPSVITFLELPASGLPPGIRLRDAARTPEGTLWFATSEGLLRFDGLADWELLTTANGLPWNDLSLVMVDREGLIWTGSGQGAAVLVPGPFRTFGVTDGLPHPFVRALALDRGGTLWAGTRAGVAARPPGGGPFRTVLPADVLPSGSIFSALALPPEAGGGVLLGEATSLVHILPGTAPGGILRPDALPAGTVPPFRVVEVGEALPAAPAYAMEGDPLDPSAAWIATPGGLVRWADGNVEPLPEDHPLTGLDAMSLAATPDGGLWIGLLGGGLRLWDGDTLHALDARGGLSNQVIWDLAAASDGSVWVATNGDGAFQVRRDPAGEAWDIRSLGPGQGLVDPFVWQAVEDGDGRIWLYTNRGLHRVEADGRTVTRFGLADGLADLEGAAAAAVATVTGDLYFGSARGLTRWDHAASTPGPVPPPVLVEEAWLGSERLQPGADLRLRSEVLGFRFAALSFRDPDGIRFRYRLTRGGRAADDEGGAASAGPTGPLVGAPERGSEWSEPTAQPTLALAGLRPGRYTLEVEAVTAAGVVSPAPATFEFRILPRFWQTWWFALLGFLAVVGTAAGIPILRARRLERDRERIAGELRATESRLAEIVEHTSNVFYSHDPDQNLSYISPAVEDVLGVPARDVPERWTEFADMDHPVTRAGMEATERALATGERQPPYELVLRHDRGHPVWVRVVESPVVRNGEVTGLVGSLTDITETKRAEAEQARLEARLEQARRMEAVGRLAGGIAHDFNNLLTAIVGHVSLVSMDLDPDDPAREDLDRVQESCRKAALLVARLLAVGRRQMAHPEPLDLDARVEAAVHRLRGDGGAGLQVEHESGGEGLEVVMDEAQLDDVLEALTRNALEAMEGSGRLVLRTRRSGAGEGPRAEQGAGDGPGSSPGAPPGGEPGQWVLLEVEDTGPGMDEETLQHVFEPFFTTKELGEGVGLGLSSVWGIVRQNHGHVEMESAPGEGTRVRVWLPAGREAAWDPEAASDP
ncbi:MAG: PAS domain S-box protein [Gemmatimonadales bacterium]|nr:MAG: PAS domain S-box protein [Gemmatimonadales bacterium]